MSLVLISIRLASSPRIQLSALFYKVEPAFCNLDFSVQKEEVQEEEKENIYS